MSKIKRNYRSTAEKQRIVSEYKNGDLSLKDFCSRKAIAPSNFWRWRKEFSGEAKADLIEVKAEPTFELMPDMAYEIELKLPAGILLRIRTA